MKRDIILFIDDILENIGYIESFSKDLSKKELEKNELKQYAIIRAIEIIGEAVKNIPNSFRNNYSELPWKKIAGMRDIITHGYFRVDLDAVWLVIRKDLPDLKQKILKIKKDLKNQ
jgi:uncharacterized protein with HEPN domain